MKLAAVAVMMSVTICCVAPPLSTTAAAAAPSTPSSCYPQTKKGNCYEPGEICRKSDHGASGMTADGESIICEDNDGWRWEPAS
jgi:hypothetical protein